MGRAEEDLDGAGRELSGQEGDFGSSGRRWKAQLTALQD